MGDPGALRAKRNNITPSSNPNPAEEMSKDYVVVDLSFILYMGHRGLRCQILFSNPLDKDQMTLARRVSDMFVSF